MTNTIDINTIFPTIETDRTYNLEFFGQMVRVPKDAMFLQLDYALNIVAFTEAPYWDGSDYCSNNSSSFILGHGEMDDPDIDKIIFEDQLYMLHPNREQILEQIGNDPDILDPS